jgi:hypothetical protein
MSHHHSKASNAACVKRKQGNNKFTCTSPEISDAGSLYNDSSDKNSGNESSASDKCHKWCCMYKVMSLHEDFVNEKPQLQHDLEARGHVCLFLPKFHCELNLIKLVWGYVRYRELLFSLNQSKENALRIPG